MVFLKVAYTPGSNLATFGGVAMAAFGRKGEEVMTRGEIVIDEIYCRGCGYCADFCPKKCITLGDSYTREGYRLSCFVNPGDCTACGICGFMCPHHAIEVYKYVDD